MLSGSLRGRGGGGEEWEGLLCRETERERENQHLACQRHAKTFTIIVISISSIWLSS